MKKILAIVGARPQFIKHAPLELALKQSFEVRTLHTGQHYDTSMSDVFFNELGLSVPYYQLDIGSHDHGVQTGLMMQAIEPICKSFTPDYVLVYGDTNSTLAGALVASKMNIKVIHIEAGLRSFNREMPEEINRVLTDHISSLLFAPTDDAIENLNKEAVSGLVFKTGDIMKDMVLIAKDKVKKLEVKGSYYYVTIHRPYNTNSKKRLEDILFHLDRLDQKVMFSLHPRTKGLIDNYGIDVSRYKNIHFQKPKGYFENIATLMDARALITDSGGMQKEAYILKVPCVTLRSETEWRGTLIGNWNQLLFDNLDQLSLKLSIHPQEYNDKLYGSGQAAIEITSILTSLDK